MRAGLALILIAIVVVVVLAVLVSVVVARRAGRAPWALREESDGEHMTVLAVRPGQQALVVARVPFADPDFDSQLYEARAEGRARVSALNSS